MIDQSSLLQSAISEYNSTINTESGSPHSIRDKANLVLTLCRRHDWTNQGAEAIVYLADEYGAFMLRNALALAIVLDNEDGDLDF